MDVLELSLAEQRVLGCLIEKERATPEYYPLSLNALQMACNQRTARDPVTHYDEEEIQAALDSLRERGLVMRWDQANARVPKYGHRAAERFGLDAQSLSLLAVLLLRGPQTASEARSRSQRCYAHEDAASAQEALEAMLEANPPLVRKEPKRPGHKEIRYAHALGKPEPDLETEAEAEPDPPPYPGALSVHPAIPHPYGTGATATDPALLQRVDALEARIQSLEKALRELGWEDPDSA